MKGGAVITSPKKYYAGAPSGLPRTIEAKTRNKELAMIKIALRYFLPIL
jgi:hypothetical protein